MIETLELRKNEIDDTPGFVRPRHSEQHVFERGRLPRQALRFGLAGGLNTLVDLLILNGLLWLFPTTSSLMLLAYNSLAYSLGAVNSFLLNKYWTFGQKQRTTRGELARFTLITLCSIGWSSAILWLASTFLHPLLVNATVWANASKLVAIAGTALISYMGMRLWVFVSKRPKKQSQLFPHSATLCRLHYVPLDKRSLPPAHVSAYGYVSDEHQALLPRKKSDTTDEYEQRLANEDGDKTDSRHSLSIILPAYN